MAFLHLFKASAACHKKETVDKIMHGKEIISKLFGFALFNKLRFGISALVLIFWAESCKHKILPFWEHMS